jgi:hypothetical protein
MCGQYGKFIDSKSEGETTINMYWMGNYYAELIYNTISNQVENIVLKEHSMMINYITQ